MLSKIWPLFLKGKPTVANSSNSWKVVPRRTTSFTLPAISLWPDTPIKQELNRSTSLFRHLRYSYTVPYILWVSDIIHSQQMFANRKIFCKTNSQRSCKEKMAMNRPYSEKKIKYATENRVGLGQGYTFWDNAGTI